MVQFWMTVAFCFKLIRLAHPEAERSELSGRSRVLGDTALHTRAVPVL